MGVASGLGATISQSRTRTTGRTAAATTRRRFSLRVLALLALFAVGQVALSLHLIRHELSQLHSDTADNCAFCSIAGHMGGAPKPVAALLPVQHHHVAYAVAPTAPAPAAAPAPHFEPRAPPALSRV
ncbi:MAG: hypothetical protein ACM3N5_07970 [Candidatus Eiseniibacteriota bacterium]